MKRRYHEETRGLDEMNLSSDGFRRGWIGGRHRELLFRVHSDSADLATLGGCNPAMPSAYPASYRASGASRSLPSHQGSIVRLSSSIPPIGHPASRKGEGRGAGRAKGPAAGHLGEGFQQSWRCIHVRSSGSDGGRCGDCDFRADREGSAHGNASRDVVESNRR